MDRLIGKTLGRYHIIEPLGEGGMASVYKAFDTELERTVALKVIRTEKTSDAEFLKRFKQEAKSLAKLEHPNIVHIHDYGEQDGIPYVVMPYLSGGTLKQLLEDRGQKPIPYQEAARILFPIARALEYAHKTRIIHRDIKPANILLTQGDNPMLSDFGIAKLLEETVASSGSTMAIGTPNYMPPEQWAGKVDFRTDIYALGVVYYEMVTGRCPFVGDTVPAVMHKHIYDPLPLPAEYGVRVPEPVESVLIKALAKDPENRYKDMGKFADVLEMLSRGVTGGEATFVDTGNMGGKDSGAASIPVQPMTRKGLHPALIGVGVGLLVIAAGLAILYFTGAIGGSPAPVAIATEAPAAQEEQTAAPTVQEDAAESAQDPTRAPTKTPAPEPTEADASGEAGDSTNQDAAETIVFENDFEEGVAKGFSVVYGNASVVDDGTGNQVLQIGTSEDSWPVVEFASNLSSFNITYRFRLLDCKMSSSDSCNLNFWFRGIYRGSMSGYEFSLLPQYGSANLYYDDSGGGHSRIIRQNYELEPDVWHSVLLEASGDFTTVYLDGVEIVSGETPDLTAAKLAFHTGKNSTYQFDDVIVRAFEP